MAEVSTAPPANENVVATNEQEVPTVPAPTEFAKALDAKTITMIPEFGGQGARYWDELIHLYTKGGESVRTFLNNVAKALEEDSSSSQATDSPAFETTIRLQSWLQAAENEEDAPVDLPQGSALSRAFFSYPLLGATHVANYLAFLHAAGISHEDAVTNSACAIGMSQGVVSAAIISAAKDTADLQQLAVQFVRYLFWHALRAQEATLERENDDDVMESGDATPMLAVNGLSKTHVLKAVEVANRNLPDEDKMSLSLINGAKRFNVTGKPGYLAMLKKSLESKMAGADEDQTRVPYSKRKPSGTLAFIPLSCPFHSHALVAAKSKIEADVERIGLVVAGSKLQVPVYATTTEATNLQTLGDKSIMSDLIDMQLTQVADWPATWSKVIASNTNATHVVDFGAGNGVAPLSGNYAASAGIQLISATLKNREMTSDASKYPSIHGLDALVSTPNVFSASGRSWANKFGPRVSADGKLVNKYTEALGRAPVVVAGMTPTTSLNGVDLVAAVQNAGFYGELAAGGLSRPNIFEDKVNELVSKIKPGVGISINMLYLNAKQWGFQFPMVLRMRKEGLPIESITIGAGIPTTDRAMEIMQELSNVGINLVGFKPNSVSAIHAVLDIARAMPSMKVMMQWTGGRAGGHHSFEDFHQPLEDTYGAIRQVDNVLLAVGSGFGNWEDSYQYLTGEWSLNRGSHSKMPADAILLGSRIMVAKEAATAPEVKQLLVDTPGIEAEHKWDESYDGVTGGVITVTSELGEPIHKVANRGIACWKDFDDQYFSKKKDEMAKAIALDKEKIIARLNADFQKPYFGCKKSAATGEIQAADLSEMSYYGVLARMIDLMYVDREDSTKRWLHSSYMDRVAKFLLCTEQRFRRSESGAVFDTSGLETSPRQTLQDFAAKYPKVATTLLSIADIDYFVELCRSGGKPVNFIPVVDGELRTWFKKDSLWYSEDLDAVPDRDAQRVCILQGPVAVRYSKIASEPVADILNGMAEGYVKVAKESSLEAVSSATTCEDSPEQIAGLSVSKEENCLRINVPADVTELPSATKWTQELSSKAITQDWMVALLTSDFIAQGKKWISNPVRSLLQPRAGQVFEISDSGLKITDAQITTSAPVVEVTKKESKISVTLREVRPKISTLSEAIVPLELSFTYVPEVTCSIHENEAASIETIKDFYARFWVAEDGNEDASCKKACEESIFSTFTDEVTISEEDIIAYNKSLGLSSDVVAAPADYSTILCWRPLIKSVFTKEVQGNLLNLVHLKHSYKLLSDKKASKLFYPGDEIVSSSEVSSLRIIESGKIVSGIATISRKVVGEQMEETLEPLVELRSEFLIRGNFDDFSSTFSVDKSVERITMHDEIEIKNILSKCWFQLKNDANEPQIGDVVVLDTTTVKRYADMMTLSSVTVTGTASIEKPQGAVEIAAVDVQSENVSESPVVAFLMHRKKSIEDEVTLGSGYNTVETPLSISVPNKALDYAVASHDLNPIHRSDYAATLANLPQGKPIMHGMWTATKVRALLAKEFGRNDDSSVSSYAANFDGMVYPGDQLYMQVRHVGQSDGKKVMSVEVVNEAGQRVVSARAEIKQPPVAFVFTGQGSAQVGMGMDRYQESKAARETWDKGDRHLRAKFGFSILEMVRKNPSSITIHFGGRRGKQIRENYMKLTVEDPETGEMAPLLPEIHKHTQSFTFSAPEGLLFATQFSQPALVLLEKATFAEIEEAQLIPDDALFAGHSLGEYAGLSSFAGALAVEAVSEVVFLRGLIMQKAVKRDENGRSDYGMMATNPTRVGPKFTEDMMYKLVDGISSASGKLLQVVNFNVQGRQYVVAGTNANLEALSLSLAAFKSGRDVAEVDQVIKESLEQAHAKKEKAEQAGRPFVVARGVATIPLAGIDVPFHSRELLGGVPAFRSLLRSKFEADVLERQLPRLINRYIPNLVAEPFTLEKSYFELVHSVTKSPYIAEVLDETQWSMMSRAQLAQLLVVELLAYQFASPVQWIKTQALLFSTGGTGVSRFIEIGPAATLTTMAQRTLQAVKFARINREILWYQRDRDVVHFEVEDSYPSASDYARELAAKKAAAKAKEEEVQEEVTADTAPPAPAPAQAAPAPAPMPVMSSPAAAPAEDAPVSALHVLRVLLAVKLNKELNEVAADSDVKTLCAGKSAVQNEILGDLEKEFGSAPDGAGEAPLKELAGKFSSYKSLGKVTSGMVSKSIGAKMPGGFSMSNVKEYLTNTKGLGAGRMESVLVHGLLMAPKARLKNENEAKEWLDSVVDSYATFAGVSLAKPAMPSGPVGGMPFGAAPAPVPTVTDAPVDAKHALKVLLAVKLSKSFSEITDETTIKEQSGGKSALQNEVLGDLEKEFGSGPDDTADLKISELAGKFSDYKTPGKVTSGLMAKLFAGKMPGGFGLAAIKDHLSKERCLPAGRIESVLLHTLTQNPKNRFADEGQAKTWLDGVADDYAKFAAIDIPYYSKLGASAGGMPQQAMQPAALPSDFDKRLKSMIADQVAALNSYLGKDSLDIHRKIETEVDLREEVEASVNQWMTEHGEFYANGIVSAFDANKERVYDSYWNWAVQDGLELYFRTIQSSIKSEEETSLPLPSDVGHHFKQMSQWINSKLDTVTEESALPPLEWFKPYLCNRATPELLRATKYFAYKTKQEGHVEYAQAIQLLVEQLEEWLHHSPMNVQIFHPTQPDLTIHDDGSMDYAEIPRVGVADSTDYVDELARGLEYSSAEVFNTFDESASAAVEMPSAVGFESTVNNDSDDSDDDSYDEGDESPTAKNDTVSAESKKEVEPAKGPKLAALRESLRRRNKKSGRRQSLVEKSTNLRTGLNENLKEIVLPHVHIRKPSDVDPTIRLYDVESTCMLLSCMREMASTGVSFAGKVALVTGCGRNSIGAELVKSLLEGGATVFVTTSSFNSKSTGVFRSVYEQHGSKGSRLIVLPFNQGSKVDVKNLVAHIYDVHKLDLDFVIPFGALSDLGRKISDIDSRSELAHRILLTNTVRLLGEVVSAKQSRGIFTRPALAILPLSPNHGNFGSDGLYAESKLGMESLMNKWYSEGWEDQLSVVGAIIGWTRGTGLMSGNNIVASAVEKMGMRTFTTTEMGFNLSALLHPQIVDRAAEAPIWADLTGGMAQVHNLNDKVTQIREDIMHTAKLRATIHQSLESEKKTVAMSNASSQADQKFKPAANLSSYYSSNFPGLSGVGKLAEKKEQKMLNGMVDLSKVVVVAGYGEVGPWGNARTRWEMESYGEFSLEGCIELAWLTGHITYDNGKWVDAKTKEAVADHEIKKRYEEELLAHAGIRIIEPELFEGYDPNQKMILHQVAIDKKMAPVEVADREEAIQFRKELGEDNVDIFEDENGTWMIRLRKGSVLSIPRALDFNRFVAGQIPTGWSAERYGIPKDLAESVDPLTLYVLVSTMEAFVASGITDPYEFYQYVHVSEVGNTSGGGMGGMNSFKKIYQDRFMGKSVPSDTLQECFINTAPAWVNMLLLSSSGPIKTPVGACATAAESVDIGVETIKTGKARIVIVGGYDDFGEEGSYEFAQMKATSDSVKEYGMGREASEMCRPCSTTRGGFMESHGAGIQLLMDAQLAIDMGCPIYGVVALTSTATDKNGRSVPAPGQGILTTAREQNVGEKKSPLLDVNFRRRQFDSELASIESWYEREKEMLDDANAESQLAFLNDMKKRKVQSAQSMWGEHFHENRMDIAPLRGALSAWNLTVDDIGVASFHGTGTKANDRNESEVTQKQLQHLGRSSGNVLPIVCQKYMTGHPKGAAASWMFNGLLQILNSGLIPGNRNLDNTCETLRKFDLLAYPNRSIQTDGIKAAVMKSFGFGQAGGEILVVHPDYLLSMLDNDDLTQYSQRREQRLVKMNSYLQESISGKGTLIKVKGAAPYTNEQESNVYLDPSARAEFDPAEGSWNFGGNQAAESKRSRSKKHKNSKQAHASTSKKADDKADGQASEGLESALSQTAAGVGLGEKGSGIGVDVEPVATFENLHGREDFIRRNFTDQEVAYCYSAPNPAASFAGRWAAKEAIIKAISNASPSTPNVWKGAGAPLREIEIFMTASGAPSVLLAGHASQVFSQLGLSSVSVSISHSGDYAVSQAVAQL